MATHEPDTVQNTEPPSVVIAKLVPIGQDAEQAFNDVVAFPSECPWLIT